MPDETIRFGYGRRGWTRKDRALRWIISVICIVLVGSGAVQAMPVAMNVDRLSDLCAATRLESAAEIGAELGWQNLAVTEIEEWRTGFVAQNGGSVALAGWKHVRDGKEEETVSF